MTEPHVTAQRISVRNRPLHYLAAALALVLLSGAVFPLLLMADDNNLGSSDRSRLQLLSLFPYAISVALLIGPRRDFLRALVATWPLVLILGFAVLSVLWSVSPSLTLKRAIALNLSTLLAVMLALRFSPRELLWIFATTLGGLTFASLCMAAVPSLGLMPGEMALRGVFTHKNVLGWVASLTVVFAVALLFEKGKRAQRVAFLLMAIGWAALLGSRSATGLLSAVSIMILAFVLRGLKASRGINRFFRQLLLAGGAVFVLAGESLYIGQMLEALGKDPTFTGRIPLWKLVDQNIAVRPMLGHGYGAFWSDASPGSWAIWAEIGWKAPHAHNGYRDVLLALGMAGFALVCVFICRAGLQTWKLVMKSPETIWLWPVLVIAWTVVLNLSETTLLTQNNILWVCPVTAAISAALACDRARVHRRALRNAALVPV